MEPLAIAKPSGENVKKKVKDSKNSGLKKCFSALVDRKQVNLELDVLRLMLRKELHINLESLDLDLSNILPYVLVFYIKNWPGWQKSVDYYTANMSFKVWYEKFYNFITLKLNETINTHYKEAITDSKKDKQFDSQKLYMLKEIVDRNTQTDNLAPKAMAPFSIEITAKPILLNTIVFTDTQGDIILKQHSILEWDKTVSENITLKQIITWPHVGVHMHSPIFSFSRRNLHDYKRHISLVGTPLPSLSTDFIEEIKIIDPKNVRNCYSLDYIKKMSSDFLKALGNVYKTANIMEAFQTVIDEFLADIAEINIPRDGKLTMGSNTSVLFNIGKSTYFRNKKLSKGSATKYDISYTEIVIPKMETSLNLIETEEKIKNYLDYLNKFDPSNDPTRNTLPQITFSCSFCTKTFEQCGLLATHLKEDHKMEQPMLCIHCKKSFPAYSLSDSRWDHNCTVMTRS